MIFCFHDDNESEAVEAHIPRHRDSKTKKPRHWDFKTIKPRHRVPVEFGPLCPLIEFAATICRGNLPWEFAVAFCRGDLLLLFAVAICRGNLPQLFAVAICRMLFVYVSKPFFCVCKSFLCLCKQTFFKLK